jgi:hypothetical protein
MNAIALLNAVSGYKTYLVAACAIAYLIWCKHAGRQPDESVLGLFGALGLGCLRHGSKTDLDRVFAPVAADLPSALAGPVKPAGTPFPPGTLPGERGHVLRPVMVLVAGLTALLILLVSNGCASARNEVVYETTKTTTETNGVVVVDTVKQSTKTDAHTLFDGKNTIANLRAGQTTKGGQTIGVTGQSQESTSDVIKASGDLAKEAVQLGASTVIKAVAPVPLPVK